MAKTFDFDNELPSLPLPDLKSTLKIYLESLRPLLTPKDLNEVEAIVQELSLIHI